MKLFVNLTCAVFVVYSDFLVKCEGFPVFRWALTTVDNFCQLMLKIPIIHKIVYDPCDEICPSDVDTLCAKNSKDIYHTILNECYMIRYNNCHDEDYAVVHKGVCSNTTDAYWTRLNPNWRPDDYQEPNSYDDERIVARSGGKLVAYYY